MNRRVLLVDDDLMLLSSMRRCIGTQYDFSTSPSGEEALALMERSETFAVIITDMRMPRMDGIEFIHNARQISPDSIYLMLTGNQDAKTAVRAVNEGQVKRFLNKPCDPSEISAEIDLALRQYEVNSKERELLSETLIEIIRTYSGVIEKLAPQLMGRANRTAQIMESIRQILRINSRWEYALTPSLLQIGYVLAVTEDDSKEPTWEEAGQRVSSEIAVIPRMKSVTEILSTACIANDREFEESPTSDEKIAATGGTLLRAACIVEQIISEHASYELGIESLQKKLVGMTPAAVEAALTSYRNISASYNSVESGVE